jgi:hypothetical protein
LAYFYNATPSRKRVLEFFRHAQNALERGRRELANEAYAVVTSQ